MAGERFDGQGLVAGGAISPALQETILRAVAAGAFVACAVPPDSTRAAAALCARVRAAGVESRLALFPADLSFETEVDAFFDQALDWLPGLQALICAARPGTRAPKGLLELTLGEWNETLGRGLREPFIVARRGLDGFLANGEGGRLVFLSNAPVNPRGCQPDAAAAQTALFALIRSIAKEYGRRQITCNGVSIEFADDALALSRAPGRPVADWGAVAETVLFLASTEASYVNATLVPVLVERKETD